MAGCGQKNLAFRQAYSDPQSHGDENGAQQKRNSPSPCEQIGFGQKGRKQQEPAGSQDKARDRAAQRQARIKAAPIFCRKLKYQSMHASLLARNSETLEDSQADQKNGGEYTNFLIVRQHADQKSGYAHQHERQA